MTDRPALNLAQLPPLDAADHKAARALVALVRDTAVMIDRPRVAEWCAALLDELYAAEAAERADLARWDRDTFSSFVAMTDADLDDEPDEAA